MKKYIGEFFRRGLLSCGFGPLILAILYMILKHRGDVQLLTVNEVCLGILSLSALAFIAGGMNFIYQVEQLPLMAAILVHGCVLYISYLATYLVNGWLAQGAMPILVFSGVFVLGYLIIWVIIYTITKRNTNRLNKIIIQKQHSDE